MVAALPSDALFFVLLAFAESFAVLLISFLLELPQSSLAEGVPRHASSRVSQMLHQHPKTLGAARKHHR